MKVISLFNLLFALPSFSLWHHSWCFGSKSALGLISFTPQMAQAISLSEASGSKSSVPPLSPLAMGSTISYPTISTWDIPTVSSWSVQDPGLFWLWSWICAVVMPGTKTSGSYLREFLSMPLAALYLYLLSIICFNLRRSVTRTVLLGTYSL